MIRAAIIATIASVAAVASAAPIRALAGWPTYDRYCLACHGTAGDGRGPAAPFLAVRPRAFTRGEYAWRSTVVGQPPTDDDLRVTVRFGARGTPMPGFELTADELDRVVEVVKAFAPAAFSHPGRPFVLGSPPTADLARGRSLWSSLGCVACHGATGGGDGPSARVMTAPPYDLARTPLRRPRANDDPAARRLAAAASIATGISGTAMPAYAGIAPADLWALADHVVELGARAPQRSASLRAPPEPGLSIEKATWPGQGAPDEAALFGGPIPAQGPAPSSLAPAEASLHARQCARCHAKQFREWEPSIHGGAISAGVLAQLDFDQPAAVAACTRCHAPLAEQTTDRTLRAEGVQCAVCHVRAWTRSGPPAVAASLLPIAGYPLVTLPIYERADFCMPCHQLPPHSAVAGKPLLDTYREWLAGPYLPRGVQCQHCHMPNREHTVLGIHDPATFRQGIELSATAHRAAGVVTATAVLRNIGAGHDLPTTPTPAVWLAVQLIDARGTPIAGATASLRIGRDVDFDGTWHERADTRIAPGNAATFARAWSGGRTNDAAIARVTVEVHPDDYYERFYAAQLAHPLAVAQRALYEQALARARASHYLAESRDVVIGP